MAHSAGTAATLRVLTLNIGSLLEPEWERRRHEIVAWVDRLDPDVICFQEVSEDDDRPNAAGLIAEATARHRHWAFGGGELAETWPGATGRFGSAVLSRWPIDESTCHLLGHAEADAPGDAIVAVLPWELFHVRTAGIDLFSTHLAPAPEHGRHRLVQVAEIDRVIKATRGDRDVHRFGERREGLPPILCGDFNAEADSDEIRFLCGLTTLNDTTTFYQDAWRVAGDGPGYTNDWKRNPFCAGLNVHRKRIDYVFVGDPFLRAGDAGRVLDVRLVADEPITGIVASDHFGVMATIVWPDRPAAPAE
ncbi:MAG: endonuclease/exonuclease/phosphatase family protein [Microthrixaceae bacterium]|nr:endonuclease/exonuclease/phosphatase family protein [Microthrixaceae bacterium]